MKRIRWFNAVMFFMTCVCLLLSSSVPGFEIKLDPSDGMPANLMGAIYWPVCMGFVFSIFPSWTD